MLEVRPRLLLGSMGDALAVLSGVPSITKVYTVTHLLSVCNDPPDLSALGERAEEKEGHEGEEEEGEGGTSGRRQMKTMFVQVADMPSSDLLEHFESCSQFIKEGVEQGTILVHWYAEVGGLDSFPDLISLGTNEFGVSRSVTVVLAYLMWTERLSLKVLFQDLKDKKPEIRPNRGFVEQLKLWERMRCRIDKSDKLYRAYRLQYKAMEMKDSGLVEEVHMSPDPFLIAQESTAYFRCRKCRRLLFTDDSLLQHELGQGQTAFTWHKRSHQQHPPARTVVKSHPPASSPSGQTQNEPMLATDRGDGGGCEREVGDPGGRIEGENLHGDSVHTEGGKGERDGDNPQTLEANEVLQCSTLPATDIPSSEGGAPPSATPLTLSDMARIRAQVASVVALGNQSSVSSACSSYFIEPVEWMGDLLLGEMEGKLLCPKCSARLGSFNWAGEQCSCGRWVTPSFQVHRSRVDETQTLVRRKNVGQGGT